MVKSSQRIDGNNVLYHYLQKDLRETDFELFQMLTARLVTSLGIWFHPDLYARLPVLLPYAVRDPECRGSKSKGIPDQWGSPNASGYFRDDNSIVKALPQRLQISGSSDIYRGKFMGTGFVASHVWRIPKPGTTTAALASRDPLTYSFVPNLIWLPVQVSKLTDREGAFVQRYLQALSHKLYGDVEVLPGHRSRVDAAWDRFEIPPIPDQELPDEKDLNFFVADEVFIAKRQRKIRSVVDGLNARAAGEAPTAKVLSSRYTEGLAGLSTGVAQELATTLGDYLRAGDGDSTSKAGIGP